MTPQVVRSMLMVGLVGALGAATPARAIERPGIEHTLAGALQRVDAAAGRVVVRTADGAEFDLLLTKSTRVDSANASANLVDLPRHKGEDVIAVYTVDGGVRTATLVTCPGPGGLKMAEGTLAQIDLLAKRVAIRTPYGEEIVFQFGEKTIFDASVRLAPPAALMPYQGEQVVVYYTVAGEGRILALLRLNLEIPNC